jgi:hypothetical protein
VRLPREFDGYVFLDCLSVLWASRIGERVLSSCGIWVSARCTFYVVLYLESHKLLMIVFISP